MKYCFACLLIMCLSTVANSQKGREVVIFSDTLIEFNKYGSRDDPYIGSGVRIRLFDSLGSNVLWSIDYIKKNEFHGDSFSFSANNMLEKKEQWVNGKRHGTFYYWNKKGFLTRTEVWKNDKLISKRFYKADR